MIRNRLIAAAFAAFAAIAPAVAAPVEATATYAVTLGGTNVATVTIALNDTGQRYAMGLSARVTGFAQMVASGIAKVESAGISHAAGLTAEKFDLMTRAQGQDFNVDVEFANRDVTQFVITPPVVNEIDRVALERRHLTGVNDMMAAFVIKGPALDAKLCDRKMQIFNGVERFNIAMSFVRADEATSPRTGYQGPLVLCNLRYTPVSGHFTTSELTTYLAESERILVWYAPLGQSGTFIPYRALLATASGDLSIVLTALKQ